MCRNVKPLLLFSSVYFENEVQKPRHTSSYGGRERERRVEKEVAARQD